MTNLIVSQKNVHEILKAYEKGDEPAHGRPSDVVAVKAILERNVNLFWNSVDGPDTENGADLTGH